MGKKTELDFGLATLDDLFSTQEERDEAQLKKIEEIPLELIDPFPDHPYKVRDDEDMANLVESIKEYGVLTPATVRKKADGRYELLSGHRRKMACEKAGLFTLRAEVVEMNKDAATIFMVDSNLQRTTILPSEKAFSYKMRLEAMKRQGKRNDLTSEPVARKLMGKESAEILGEAVGEGKDNIRRYIRLTELLPDLLDMVDEGKIALRPAVEMSYIPKGLQRSIADNIAMEQCTPSHDQTIRMRKAYEKGELNAAKIAEIMQEEKPNQKEKIMLKSDKVKKYLPKDLPIEKREAYIVKALEFYGKYRKSQDRSDAR